MLAWTPAESSVGRELGGEIAADDVGVAMLVLGRDAAAGAVSVEDVTDVVTKVDSSGPLITVIGDAVINAEGPTYVTLPLKIVGLETLPWQYQEVLSNDTLALAEYDLQGCQRCFKFYFGRIVLSHTQGSK